MESSTAAQHAYGIVVLNVVNCNARYSDSAWPDPTHASGSSAELVFAHQEAHLHQRTFITPLAQAVQLTSQHNVRQRPHLGRGSYGRRLLGHQQLDRPTGQVPILCLILRRPDDGGIAEGGPLAWGSSGTAAGDALEVAWGEIRK
jgi:hypothetical protein